MDAASSWCARGPDTTRPKPPPGIEFDACRCRTRSRSEEHTSELQSLTNLVCRLLLEKKKNSAHMSRLTEDLLTLARVESGEHRFDMQRVSVDELLRDALESFREVARSFFF